MAARLAISDHFSGVSLAALTRPPFAPPSLPSATAAWFFPLGGSGGASPTASLATRKAISFTSSGPCFPLLERLGMAQNGMTTRWGQVPVEKVFARVVESAIMPLAVNGNPLTANESPS